MSGRLTLLLTFLAALPGAWSCPGECECAAGRRGQQVVCRGGELSVIMDALPHDTERLVIDGMASSSTLTKADVERSASSSILFLTISNSGVQEVGPAVFSSFNALQKLDLSSNNIRSIHPQAFEGLNGLQALNLSSNRIDSLGQSLEPLVSLHELDLSVNFIKDLEPGTFQTQSSLSMLRLDGNNLRRLSGDAFKPMGFLSELRVRDCGIFYISDDFFTAVTRVRLLDVGENRLTKFPSSTAFADFGQLKHLLIDDNELLDLLPSQFHDLSLVTLSLARNRISSISAEVFSGLMVEDVDLSENKLLELKGAVLQPIAPHLRSLNLALNPIRSLQQETFQSLLLLESLNVSACSLSELASDALGSLHRLRQLDASWNHVQNISKDLIKMFRRLQVINLQGNSWHCDCHITPLRDWMRLPSSRGKLYCLRGRGTRDCADLKCTAPDDLVGKRIVNLVDLDVEKCGGGAGKSGLPVPIQISIVLACLLFSLGMLLLAMYLWRRGRTKKGLKRIIFQRRQRPDSPQEEDEEGQEKIDPFINCDNDSLKESHRSFVFRNYFDTMVTDPKLLEPTSPSQMGPSGAQRDSLYSSNPSLYEKSHNSHSIVVGIESTV